MLIHIVLFIRCLYMHPYVCVFVHMCECAGAYTHKHNVHNDYYCVTPISLGFFNVLRQ